MCDLLVALPAATAEGVTLFAKNSDRPPLEAVVVEELASRREARTRATHLEIAGHHSATRRVLAVRPAWMWGIEMGVNDAGVAAGNATIYTTLDPRSFGEGLTGMDLVRLGLERADTAGGAVEVILDLIAAHGQGGSGHEHGFKPYWSSFMVADPSWAFVVETSGTAHEVMELKRTWATSNRTTLPSFDARHRHPRQPVATLVDPRLEASRAVLTGAPVTVAGLQEHLASHAGGENGWTVCMHVEDVEATTASMVAALRPDGLSSVEVALGNPCRTPYRSVRFDPLP